MGARIWERHPTLHAYKSLIDEKRASQNTIEKWKEPSVSMSIAPLGLGYLVLFSNHISTHENTVFKVREPLQIEESSVGSTHQKRCSKKNFWSILSIGCTPKNSRYMQHQSLIMAHKSVQGRVEVGVVPKAVLAQLESELADLELLQIEYRSSIRIHQLRLEELLGRPWEENIDLQPPPDLPNTRGTALRTAQNWQKHAQLMSQLQETNKRPPPFFPWDTVIWWWIKTNGGRWASVSRSPSINVKKMRAFKRVNGRKKTNWEEKALLETWNSKVQAEEERVRGLLAQREVIQKKPSLPWKENVEQWVLLLRPDKWILTHFYEQSTNVSDLDHDANW